MMMKTVKTTMMIHGIDCPETGKYMSLWNINDGHVPYELNFFQLRQDVRRIRSR